MIDTHAHLSFPQLEDKTKAIVEKSREAGLKGIIIASSNLEESKKGVELAKKYPDFLFPSIGIHPQKTDVENKKSGEEQLKELEKLIQENQNLVVALGETGFDFGEAPPEEEERSLKEQKQLFLGQINLALKYDLALIVHAREANDEAIEFLKANGNQKLRAVFHCYSGGRKRIERILNLPGNWFFGVDGNLTYDQGLQNVVKNIPREKLVLETDAPFLAPEPYRGETCFPHYLPLIAQKLAQVWAVDLEEVVFKTMANTRTLFRLKI